jgi:hypothetical protein
VDFKEITAKSILVKSNVPGIDYVVNPWTKKHKQVIIRNGGLIIPY